MNPCEADLTKTSGCYGKARLKQVLHAPFAGIVGCRHVEMGVKTTDMCLSGQHVANMSANMSAT
jgi:hypothetical protein